MRVLWGEETLLETDNSTCGGKWTVWRCTPWPFPHQEPIDRTKRLRAKLIGIQALHSHPPPIHFDPSTRLKPSAARPPHPPPTLAKNSLLPLRMKYRLLQSFSQLLCFVNHPVICCKWKRVRIRAHYGQSSSRDWSQTSEEPLATWFTS